MTLTLQEMEAAQSHTLDIKAIKKGAHDANVNSLQLSTVILQLFDLQIKARMILGSVQHQRFEFYYICFWILVVLFSIQCV